MPTYTEITSGGFCVPGVNRESLYSATSSVITATPLNKIATKLTLMYWVKYDAVTNYNLVGLYWDSDRRMRIGTNFTNNAFIFDVPGAGGSAVFTIANNTWYHLAIAVDCDAGEYQAYRNGIVMATGSTTPGIQPLWDLPFGINCDIGFWKINGFVSDMRLYSDRLSIQQISRCMNGEVLPDNLEYHFSLNGHIVNRSGTNLQVNNNPASVSYSNDVPAISLQAPDTFKSKKLSGLIIQCPCDVEDTEGGSTLGSNTQCEIWNETLSPTGLIGYWPLANDGTALVGENAVAVGAAEVAEGALCEFADRMRGDKYYELPDFNWDSDFTVTFLYKYFPTNYQQSFFSIDSLNFGLSWNREPMIQATYYTKEEVEFRGAQIDEDKRHHIALVYKHGSSVAVFVNGELSFEKPIEMLDISSSAFIGRFNNGSLLYGDIQDFRIYDQALNPGKIALEAETYCGNIAYEVVFP